MARHRGTLARSFVHVIAFVLLASCGEETPSSNYALPLRLNPLRVQGASDADTVAAWAVFDRDTTTRWSPQSEGGAELAITLDAQRPLAYLKVFGPATGILDLRTEGGSSLAAPVDLSRLRSGWNQIALPAGDPLDRLTLHVAGAASVPDIELWSLDSPRVPLQTEGLHEQLAWGRLEGLADVVATEPSLLTLAASGGERCGDFLFEVPRDPSVYRRAWITYGATGLFRPFVVTRALNDSPKIHANWLRHETAVGVFVEPIDPERLVAGLNWFQVCLPAEAGGSLVLQDARFVGELDTGTNSIEAVSIGLVDAAPTRSAMNLLDPGNTQALDVAAGERIVLAFERWISPDGILLATDRADRSDWQVECIDATGAATRLTTESAIDGERGVALVVRPAGEILCAGLSLRPARDARVSFLTVAGSGARQRVDWTRVVLASPREHFGRVAWVEGWAMLPASAAGEASIEIDGVDTGTTLGVFGQLLQRQGNRDDAWPVTITARLADGTSATRQFVLGRYSDPSGVVEGALGDRGTQLSPEESAERYGEPGETVSQTIDPDTDASIRLGTHVGVDIPAGAVNGHGVTISITHLEAAAVPRIDPTLINVTAPLDHAYEFLPHGQEFRKPVTVLLPFDSALLPPGYTTEDVNAYYFDEEAQRWKRLSRAQVDGAAGTTRSHTDHFTVMINAILVAPEHPQVGSFNPNELSGITAADPTSRMNLIDPPSGNSKGGAGLQYPIDVPPGRAGLHPSLALQYNSSKGNGWVGMGWDLPVPAIGIDTRFGAPRFDPTVETETYTLNGAQLTPIAHRGPPRGRADGTTTIDGDPDPVKIFHERVEGQFSRIIRHGDHPNNYWWEVVDKMGVRYFYGGDPDTDGPAEDSTLVSAAGDVFLWALREVRDPHGNFARYCAERVSDAGVAGSDVTGWELYLARVDYTRNPDAGRSCDPEDLGPYRVVFKRDSHVGAPRRPDVIIDGRGRFKRVTAQLLRRIEVYYGAELVRAYDLDYRVGPFHKSLLTSIRQFGLGNLPFDGNLHEFEYFDDVRTDPSGQPANYTGFAAEQSWETPDDDIDSGLIIPGAVLGAFGPDEPSVLGGGNSHSGAGHVYIGFNPTHNSKQGSYGGKVGFGGSVSEGVAAFVDVDGDTLADKVFRTDSGFVFRRNESGPSGAARFSDDVHALPGLPGALSKDMAFNFSFGVEVYPLIFAVIYNHNEAFTRTSTYLSDANGDGLIDLVSEGQVLFNRRTAGGGQEFVNTSTGTPFPIIPGEVDTAGLLPDYEDIRDDVDEANPIVDTVRFWVAPFSGWIDITAPVNLVRASSDGVRVAIQRNNSELWSQVISGNDTSVKTPTGVEDRFVFAGDRIYFRVNSRDNGKDDEVAWNPTIQYSGLSETLDANGLDATRYQAGNDFILGGRSSIAVVTPFEGTVRLQGTFDKKRVTTDNVRVELKRNGVTFFASTRIWNTVGTLAIDESIDVDPDDQIELFVRADSPVDLTAVEFDPAVEMTYTSAVDGDGNPVMVSDAAGNPIFRSFVPYDMDIYSVKIPAGLPDPWVSTITATLPITVEATLPTTGGSLVFTAKEQGGRLAKHTFFPRADGAMQTFTFDLEAEEDKAFYFDFSSRDRDVAFGSTTRVGIDFGFFFFTLPRAINTVTDPDMCTRPYRGWSYAGYVPNPDDMDAPIRHSGEKPFCSTDTGANEDTPLEEEREPLEENVSTLEGMVTRAFVPFPGGRTCNATPNECQIPSGVLWGGAGELQYITPSLMSSSRQGAPDVSVPSSADIAGAGATAVARFARASEDGLSAGGSIGPLGLNGSISSGRGHSEVDYLDMNGDKFPDIVSHSGVQYTDPRGTLAERLPVLSGVRESDSIAYSVGIGGTVARSVSNGKGRFGPTGTGSGSNSENDNQMAEIGFSLSVNGNISTHDVNHELIDVNGDDLPDRVTADGGDLIVQLNTGYEFAGPETWDDDSTINTGNGNQIGGGATLGYNSGEYGWSGGISVGTSTQRINEYVDVLQRDGQTLSDVNGDGLLDRVVADGGTLAVRFNTGNGFAGGSDWTGLLDRDLTENKSATMGTGFYFTIGIGPLCVGACYLIINPGGDVNESLHRPEAALQDVNGDGYVDHVVSEDDGQLRAALNNHGRTNLLKTVRRPMNAWFELDYARKGNTFEDPHSHWVLSRMTQFDGLPGDGVDYQLKTFEYGPGFYDRFEREFYGFAQVVEIVHDTGAAGDPEYRKTRQEYHNDSFFTHGLLRRETVIGLDGGAEATYRVTESSYLLREVDTGSETSDAAVLRLTLSAVFPQLQTTTTRVSEGDPTVALETQTTTTYDDFGNPVTYSDTGDVGADDDYTATMTYTGAAGGDHEDCADGHIVGLADSIIVRDSLGATLRDRIGAYDCATGDLTRLEQTIDATTGQKAISNFTYAPNGNLTQVLGPLNHRDQRYQIDFTYDDDIQTHVKTVTDIFGTSSEMLYDLRFAEWSSTTDTNGNSVTRTFDDFGRLETVTGPYEQGTGHATMTFDYNPEATPAPWARTENLDPYRDLADPIETIVFTDGLKRVVQTKKDITVHTGRGSDPIDVMQVSGRLTFDHVGRTVESYYRTIEAKDDTINRTFTFTYDGVAPTVTTFDVIDRMTLTTYPDTNTMSQAFALTTDRHGALRSALTRTDELTNQKVVYTDVRKKVRARQEFNVTKGEVIWTEYAYDPLEQITEVIDDRGNRTTAAYDLLGRRTVLDNPDTGRVEMTYDPADNLIRKVTGQLSAAGEAITYVYDHKRLTEIHYPRFPDNDVAYEYGDAMLRGHGGNRVGRITLVTDESGVEAREYGKLGELTSETKTIASDTLGACAGCPEVWTTEYVFDTWGRLQQMTYPDTEVLTYSYDSGGQVRAVNGEKLGHDYAYVTRLEYDKFVKRAFLEHGNGVQTAYTYDPLDRRLDRLEAGDFQDLNYEYDAVGNVTRLLNDRPPANPNEMGGNVEQVFQYDSLYRVTHATGTFRYGPQKTDAYELTLDYDTIHNILTKTQDHTVRTRDNNPIPQHKTTYDVTYTYASGRPHAPSRIAGDAAPGFEDRAFTYDDSGNQLGWDDLTSGRRRTIVWDEEDRVQSIADNGRTTTYKYDDKGQRVIKRGAQGETAYINQYWTVRNRTVGTKHIFAGESRLVSKLSPGSRHVSPGDTDPFMAVIKNWYDQHDGVFPGRGVGLHLPDDNFIYYYHSDHLNSTGWVTDPDGELYEHVEYFPFGETWVEESSNTERTPYLFTSKELDQETELYYFGARYYDPRTSQWVSPDPILDSYMRATPNDGVFDPRNLGLYSYTWNNPLGATDPTGLFLKTSAIRGQASHTAITAAAIGDRVGPQVLARITAANLERDNYQGTDPASQSMHAMRNENTPVADAITNWQTRVANEVETARTQILAGNVDAARDAFGRATHTIQDHRATAHTDANGNPRIWRGMGSPRHPLIAAEAAAHGSVDAREMMSQAPAQAAIRDTRAAFDQLRQQVLGDNPTAERQQLWRNFVDRPAPTPAPAPGRSPPPAPPPPSGRP